MGACGSGEVLSTSVDGVFHKVWDGCSKNGSFVVGSVMNTEVSSNKNE
jgi:hypothetical protein